MRARLRPIDHHLMVNYQMITYLPQITGWFENGIHSRCQFSINSSPPIRSK
jgi:hypothetical protein